MSKSLRKKTALPWLWLSIAIIIVDQLSKLWMLHHLQYLQPMVLLPFLNFMLAFNAGAAFSFLGSAGGWQIYLFSGISLLIAALFVAWLYQTPRAYYWRGMALGLIIGGAIGNCIDRIRLNYVIDFIDFHIKGWHFATFNIADSAITVGAIFFIISLCRHPKS